MKKPSSPQTVANSSTKRRKGGFRWPWQKKKAVQNRASHPPPPANVNLVNGRSTTPTTPVVVTPPPPKPPRKKLKPSWFCRSKRFADMCDKVFVAVDNDNSGEVDEKELYSGMLLIHLQLGMYLGPAACKPLARDKCDRIFARMDVDDSGTLDREEFREVMTMLFGNVFIRVIVQWSMTIMIVPMMARTIVSALYALMLEIYEVVTTLDEYSSIANWIELSIEASWSFVLNTLPQPLLLVCGEVGDLLATVPASVWSGIPITLVSVCLSIMIVPWIIYKIDDFFQWVVARRATETEEEKTK